MPKKARKKKQADKMISRTVRIPEPLWDDILKALSGTTLTFEELVRLHCRCFINTSRKNGIVGLSDPVKFGKYNGEKLETIILADQGYILWCLEHLEGFQISEKAHVLLNTLLEPRD